MSALKEIDYLVKQASPMPAPYLPSGTSDPELPRLFAEYRKKMDYKRQKEWQRFKNPVPKAVRLFQDRQMPDLPTRPNSAQAGPSGPFMNWQGWKNAKSTQMMVRMNQRNANKEIPKRKPVITPNNAKSPQMTANANRMPAESDAYKEILRRRPEIDPQRAKLYASMVAKNYRIDADGNWMNINGRANNRVIADRLRKMQPSNTMLAGSGASALGSPKS